ncbi:hypothetical protein [Nonomuraea longicatena]|uniref:Uncharacterized protein n=1 Tax=Nonomuraea longicatena TaxID=83682 RepID=A0ABN1PBK5_9ACTN
MKRRILTVLAAGAITALALPAPAQAATTITYGPLSIGGYCAAQVNSTAWIGFYESTGLHCYATGPNGLRNVGSGNPLAACDHLSIATITSASRGPSDSLVCTGP